MDTKLDKIVAAIVDNKQYSLLSVASLHNALKTTVLSSTKISILDNQLEDCDKLSVVQGIDFISLCLYDYSLSLMKGFGDNGLNESVSKSIKVIEKIFSKMKVSQLDYFLLFQYLNYNLFPDMPVGKMCDMVCDKLLESKVSIDMEYIYDISNKTLFFEFSMVLKLCKTAKALKTKITSKILKFCKGSFEKIGVDNPSRYDQVDINEHRELLNMIDEFNIGDVEDFVKTLTPSGYDLVKEYCTKMDPKELFDQAFIKTQGEFCYSTKKRKRDENKTKLLEISDDNNKSMSFCFDAINILSGENVQLKLKEYSHAYGDQIISKPSFYSKTPTISIKEDNIYNNLGYMMCIFDNIIYRAINTKTHITVISHQFESAYIMVMIVEKHNLSHVIKLHKINKKELLKEYEKDNNVSLLINDLL